MKKETIKIDFSWFSDLIIQIWVMINPRYWIMNEWYSSKWDKELNNLMKNHNFVLTFGFSDCTAKLGDWEIWIANHPYASFTDHSFRNIPGRPSKLTIYKAKQKLERDLKNPQPIEENNQVMTNPCGEIPLGGFSGSTLTVIGCGDNNTSFMMMDTPKPEVGELTNGIPNNWDDEI